ncbi:MAG: fumarylacetoacetate hydrolase family protein [Candidatus Dormibacteraeota bacterium]|nr:fumarylacetoacetate hydrolase family protein [Candidatus Dormibacteraeota bacterium]
MRVANVQDRLCVLASDATATDVETASDGRFGSDPQAIFDRWADFRAWAAEAHLGHGSPVEVAKLQAPVPRPRQIFGIGLNYRDHARESGFEIPTEPVVFTKYVSSLTGPNGEIELSPGNVDWEVELVAVIGSGGRHIAEEQGWDHVAGLTLGQDVSDRTMQFAAPPAQFGLGKSYPGFSPIGPWLVAPDELPDPDDLELGCSVNGESMQESRTSQLIFSVPRLVAKLSEVVTLLPGDVIFTGTPAGVGVGKKPPRFLQPGDELVSWCTGIGEMRHVFVRR